MSGNALRQNALKKGVISINHITIEELNLNEAKRGGRGVELAPLVVELIIVVEPILVVELIKPRT
jgi:hypothetical protein